MPKKRRPWPEKRRKDQAKRARVNTPWAHSTGPTTPAGKAVCAANALKSGFHTEEMRALKALLAHHAGFIRALTQSSLHGHSKNESVQSTCPANLKERNRMDHTHKACDDGIEKNDSSLPPLTSEVR